MILVCLMAMTVSVNAQTVSVKDGNVVLTPDAMSIMSISPYINSECFAAEMGKKKGLIIPIIKLDKFVCFLKESNECFERYKKIIDNHNIKHGDNLRVDINDVYYRTKVFVVKEEFSLKHNGFYDKTYERYTNLKVSCDVDDLETPYLMITGEFKDGEINFIFKNKQSIEILLDKLSKKHLDKLIEDEMYEKEELNKEKQRKEQVESALQNAFN